MVVQGVTEPGSFAECTTSMPAPSPAGSSEDTLMGATCFQGLPHTQPLWAQESWGVPACGSVWGLFLRPVDRLRWWARLHKDLLQLGRGQGR